MFGLSLKSTTTEFLDFRLNQLQPNVWTFIKTNYNRMFGLSLKTSTTEFLDFRSLKTTTTERSATRTPAT